MRCSFIILATVRHCYSGVASPISASAAAVIALLSAIAALVLVATALDHIRSSQIAANSASASIQVEVEPADVRS